MSPNETTSFVPLDDAVSATLGSSYNKLGRQLLAPSGGEEGVDILPTLHNAIFSGSTLDGSITTTPTNPRPGLIENLADALDRPLRAHHPNLLNRIRNMPESATKNMLNAHLTGLLPPSLLRNDTLVHLPTLLATMGRNGDIVKKTDFDPDLILSSYYHILCGYLAAFNREQTLVVSLEDLGRLSVIRIKDLETPGSQGFTVSVFPRLAPDNWSSVLSHRSKHQRKEVISNNGVLGFYHDGQLYSQRVGMEHSPGTLEWYLVFLSRLIRFFADSDLPAEQVDYDSLERHKPTDCTKTIGLEASRYIAANLTVADAYNPSLTRQLVRQTGMTPYLNKNTTPEMRRSLRATDHNLYSTMRGRQQSLANQELVDSFARYYPAKLSSMRHTARMSDGHAKIRMFTIIEPHQNGEQANRFRYLGAMNALTFLRTSLLADSPNTHHALDRASQVFNNLLRGVNPARYINSST